MFKKTALLSLVAFLLIQTGPVRAEGPVTLGGGSLTALALSPDGARLAVGSTIGLYFFNAKTFALNGFWAMPYGIEQVIWSPRGDTLALVNGNDVELRQAESGAVLWKHDYTCWRYCLVTFSRDGSQVVVLRHENTASVYDLPSGQLVETITDNAFWTFSDWRLAHLATSAWQSADGKLAFVGGGAFVYEVPHRQYFNKIGLTSIPYAGNLPQRIALSPDGQRLAASEAYGTVTLWNVYDASAPLYRFRGYAAGTKLDAFAWSPDSAVLYVAGGNKLEAWDAKGGQRLRSLPGLFTPPVAQLTWSADSRRVIGVQDTLLGDWDVGSRQPTQAGGLTIYETPVWQITDMATSPAGDLVAVADVRGVTLHAAVTLSPVRRLQVGRQVSALAFSPDGQLLVTGGSGPFVNVWNPATGQPVLDLPASAQCSYIAALAFSSDGRLVYALESTGLLRQWELATKASRTVQAALPGSRQASNSAIHAGAGRVAVERGPLGIQVADLASGQPLFDLAAPSPRSIIINGQGTRLAAIVGAEVKIWKLDTGELTAAYSGHSDAITDIAFSPAGNSLASSSQDGTVKVWPVP